MDTITAVIDKIAAMGGIAISTTLSDNPEQRRLDLLNSKPGTMTGYECSVCHNKGYVFAVDERGNDCCYECECMPIRRSCWNLRNSGLEDAINAYTLANYSTPKDWQKELKAAAKDYITHDGRDWFFVYGCPGGGKTHICTAISGELLRQGKSLIYMTWTSDINHIVACAMDDYERQTQMRKYTAPDVLYIDDLFKPVKDDYGAFKKPSPGKISATFEIINARYIQNKRTIISTEHSINTLMDIDEATASRIYERSKNYRVGIKPGNNWRVGE